MDDTMQNTDTQSADLNDNNVSQNSPENTQAETMLNIESLIQSALAKIEKLQQESRKNNETLESILLSDPTYREHAEKAK